jgi:hypothetical protein
MALSGDYNELLDNLPEAWRQAVWVTLTKARQMQQSGENGKIVILITGGAPVTVQLEAATPILKAVGKREQAA